MGWAIERKVKKLLDQINDIRLINSKLNQSNVFGRKTMNRNIQKILRIESEVFSLLKER